MKDNREAATKHLSDPERWCALVENMQFIHWQRSVSLERDLKSVQRLERVRVYMSALIQRIAEPLRDDRVRPSHPDRPIDRYVPPSNLHRSDASINDLEAANIRPRANLPAAGLNQRNCGLMHALMAAVGRRHCV